MTGVELSWHESNPLNRSIHFHRKRERCTLAGAMQKLKSAAFFGSTLHFSQPDEINFSTRRSDIVQRPPPARGTVICLRLASLETCLFAIVQTTTAILPHPPRRPRTRVNMEHGSQSGSVNNRKWHQSSSAVALKSRLFFLFCFRRVAVLSW